MNNLNLPPEHRICGRLTMWERDAPNLAHYAQQTGDEDLQREIIGLQNHITRVLTRARNTRDGLESETSMDEKIHKIAKQLEEAEQLETEAFNAVQKQPILQKDWSAYKAAKAKVKRLETKLVNTVMAVYQAEKREGK